MQELLPDGWILPSSASFQPASSRDSSTCNGEKLDKSSAPNPSIRTYSYCVENSHACGDGYFHNLIITIISSIQTLTRVRGIRRDRRHRSEVWGPLALAFTGPLPTSALLAYAHRVSRACSWPQFGSEQGFELNQCFQRLLAARHWPLARLNEAPSQSKPTTSFSLAQWGCSTQRFPSCSPCWRHHHAAGRIFRKPSYFYPAQFLRWSRFPSF